MIDIERYRLVDLFNKYRNIAGEGIIEAIVPVIARYSKETAKKFREDINDTLKTTEKYIRTLPIQEEERKEARITAIHNRLEELFYDFENNIDNNTVFLLEIDRRFKSQMNKTQRKEIRDLILGDSAYVTYAHYSDEYPDIEEVEIYSRLRNKKISEIRDIKIQNLLKNAIGLAGSSGYMKEMMKDGYKGEYFDFRKKAFLKYFFEDGRMQADEYINTIQNLGVVDGNLEEEIEKAELEFFEENLQYMDEEKLLLNLANSVIFSIKLLKNEKKAGVRVKGDATNKEDIEQEMKNNITLLKDTYEELKLSKYQGNELSEIDKNGEKVSSVNRYIVRDFLSRCTSKDFLTDEDIEKIHSELLEGKLTSDLEKRKIAGLNMDDLLQMTEVYNKEGKRDKILPSAIELAEYLKDIGDTTNEQLIDLYLKGQLNLDLVSQLNMNDISEEFFRKKLEEMYGATLDCKGQEEKEQKFKELTRFTNLYKSLEEQGKFEIDKDKIIEEIIMDHYSENDMNDTISDLHKIGLISLGEAIEWTGTDSIIRRYKEGNLKPAEVRDCYNKDKITLDQLAGIIKMIPENSERYMLIGGIFPEEGDIETRDILILECMELEEGLKRKTKGEKNKRNEGNGPTNYNKYITDPFARLSLIQGLDPEYSFEMSEDGHAIITLPTFEKVIIEKMLDKNGLPSYGSATNLLDEEYYEKNREEIVVGNRINRSKMIKDLENDGVDRIIHGVESWGKNIKKYFGVDEKSRWNDEDIKKINDAIERIKRTCRTI